MNKIPYIAFEAFQKKAACALLLILLATASCKKFVEVGLPETQLTNTAVFNDDGSAAAAMAGVYARMNINGFVSGTGSGLSFLSGLTGDELDYYGITSDVRQFHLNSIVPTNGTLLTLWNQAYTVIYYSNAVIEGLEKSTGVTPSLKKQLTGEAKFVRAFAHFYLVNLFGDIPYVKITDYTLNNVVSRMPVKEVYDAMIKDLLDAKELLSDTYSFSNEERNRPNKYAATALLARVYLYNKDWANAETQATEVINNNTLYTLYDAADMGKVFLMNSMEAIWQLSPNGNQVYTNEGNLLFAGTAASLTPSLINSFETGDIRKDTWIKTVTANSQVRYVPSKYQDNGNNQPESVREYSMLLRLAEQFLIRAEARAQQGKLTGSGSAAADINVIRARAGLAPTTAVTQTDLLTAIENERRVEFFLECGHRWFDLKRMNRADAVLSIAKGENWQSTDMLYHIPESERLSNTNLTQNPGYY